MADYYNLTTFHDLKKGDTITYTSSTKINFKGAKVSIKLYGNPGQAEGGITSFTFDSSKDGNRGKTYYFSTSGGVSLCYGSSYDAYYRIACAGDGGNKGSVSYTKNASAYSVSTYSSEYTPGNGGGSGGSATYTIPSGATFRYSSSSGSFGVGGSKSINTTYTGSAGSNQTITWHFYCGHGGDGWYGGDSGVAGYGESSSVTKFIGYATPGDGGSGHVITSGDTSIPSYMGGDSSLISKLSEACTNRSLQTGGSSEPKMVVTIISINEIFPIKYRTENDFVDTNIFYYTKSGFKRCRAYYYDGIEWKDIGG